MQTHTITYIYIHKYTLADTAVLALRPVIYYLCIYIYTCVYAYTYTFIYTCTYTQIYVIYTNERERRWLIRKRFAAVTCKFVDPIAAIVVAPVYPVLVSIAALFAYAATGYKFKEYIRTPFMCK